MGRKLIFISLLSLLTLPLIQYSLSMVEEAKLNGTFVYEDKPKFSIDDWLTGDYQQKASKYFDQNIGFKGLFIKSYNQLCYSFFNTTNADKVIVGKDGVLFEKSYIESYVGLNLKEQQHVEAKLEKTAYVSNKLEKLGKKLIVMIAPDKASYYPDKIPSSFFSKENNTDSIQNNYLLYKKLLPNYNINSLDFNSVFISAKDTTKTPLFPKSGIHWSNYSAVQVMDSLSRYMKHQNKISLPRPYLKNVKKTTVPLNPDYDLGNLLNIYSNECGDVLVGDISYVKAKTDKVRLLTIGDSFYWNLYYQGLIDNMFVQSEFWYYNHQVYPASFTKEQTNNGISIRDKIKEVDVVLVLITSGALDNFAFGFIDQAYQELLLDKKGYEQVVEFYVKKIKSDKVWFAAIEKKASEKGITVDEMLILDSKYLIKDFGEKELFDSRVEIYKDKILSDADWLEAVKKKAVEKNITLEKSIELDARYMVEMEDTKMDAID